MILVDTNVLLDLVKETSDWADWALATLERLSAVPSLVINPIIYAELSVGYAEINDLDQFVAGTGLLLEDVPREALFMAGKAFVAYRRAGGSRTAVLPDFFIGAHAAVTKMPILTRDTRRYRTYFSDITLITPDSN